MKFNFLKARKNKVWVKDIFIIMVFLSFYVIIEYPISWKKK